MGEPARGFRLAEETLTIFEFFFGRLANQRNGFYGDGAVDLVIARLVDHTHGAPSQFGQDLVAAKAFAFAIIHRASTALQNFRVLPLHSDRSTGCSLRLARGRRGYEHTDYILVQHIEDFLGLLGRGSIQQFEADLNAAKCGNGVMVGTKFDYGGRVVPGNRETNTCLFDHWLFDCRSFTL